jgi:hypothetical protein
VPHLAELLPACMQRRMLVNAQSMSCPGMRLREANLILHARYATASCLHPTEVHVSVRRWARRAPVNL